MVEFSVMPMYVVPGISPTIEFEFSIEPFTPRERAAFYARLARDGRYDMGDFWALMWAAVEGFLAIGATYQEAEEQVICALMDSADLRRCGPSFRYETIVLASALIPQVVETMKRLGRLVPGNDGSALMEARRP
jgi:hypothetical protein